MQSESGVALVAVGALAEAGDDAARLWVDRDLAAVDQMRALAGLSPQPGVGVGLRGGGGV